MLLLQLWKYLLLLGGSCRASLSHLKSAEDEEEVGSREGDGGSGRGWGFDRAGRKVVEVFSCRYSRLEKREVNGRREGRQYSPKAARLPRSSALHFPRRGTQNQWPQLWRTRGER
jgi:hypothetical protein